MLSRSSDAVEFKGYGNDINIILDNKVDFSDIEAGLTEKLEKSDEFFSGREVILDVGDRILNLGECARLDEILNTNFGLIVSQVRSRDDETRRLIEDFGWQLVEDKRKIGRRSKKAKKTETNDKPKTEERNIEDKNSKLAPSISGLNDTHLFKGTIRGGQKKTHRGNIVIIGDVNPGGEVIATGDIIVIGKLRGIAHAGAQGNTLATILALDLRPIQLRIAGCIGRSPDPDADAVIEKANEPEVAEIEDGQIVIHKLR